MKFWNNIFRYPRFFISSILGLFLILISPFFQIFKNTRDKKTFIFLFLWISIIGSTLTLILNLMFNSNSY